MPYRYDDRYDDRYYDDRGYDGRQYDDRGYRGAGYEPYRRRNIFTTWWVWMILTFVFAFIAFFGDSIDLKAGVDGVRSCFSGGEKQWADEPEDFEEDDGGGDTASTMYEIGGGMVRTWKDSLGTQWVSAYVPVTNTGTDDLYLSSGTLDIEDSSGNFVMTMRLVSVYPQVLRPGETAYYFEETTSDVELPPEGLEVVAHADIRKATVSCVRLEVSETAITENEFFGVSVTGRVENNTDSPMDNVYIAAHLFDSSGNLIVQQFTILDNDLQPGEKIGFSTSNLGYEAHAQDVASYEVYAFRYQFQF